MKTLFLVLCLISIPAQAEAEDLAQWSDAAVLGAGAAGAIYNVTTNFPELGRLREEKVANDAALKKAVPADMPNFAELANLQRQVDAFVYRDRAVLDAKKKLADLELALADQKINDAQKSNLLKSHSEEAYRLVEDVEPAAEKRWVTAFPAEAARYKVLANELKDSAHFDRSRFLQQSLKTKIALRSGIGLISILGAGYAAFYGVDRAAEKFASPRVKGGSFSPKVNRSPAMDPDSARTFLEFKTE